MNLNGRKRHLSLPLTPFSPRAHKTKHFSTRRTIAIILTNLGVQEFQVGHLHPTMNKGNVMRLTKELYPYFWTRESVRSGSAIASR